MRLKEKRLIPRFIGGFFFWRGGFWDINIPASGSLVEQIAGVLFIKNSSFLREAIMGPPDSDKLLLTNQFALSHIRQCHLCVRRLSY